MTKIDLTVFGAGIFGLSVAFGAARRGARVRVIDPAGPGGGASGGIVGALAPHVPERWNEKKAFQFNALIAADGFWAEVQAVADRDPGFARLGRIQPLEDDAAIALAEARALNAQTLWQGKASWRVRETCAFADWAPQSPTGLLIEDTLSSRLHPRRACEALANAVAALGGDVRTHGEAEGRVVLATGWRGLLDLSKEFGVALGGGVKGQAALLAVSRPDAPQIFADGLHIVPHSDGTVAIGSTSERDFTEPETPDGALDAVIDTARRTLPMLADAPVLARWAGVRPRARTRAPMLGPHPTQGGVFIANGGFKIGFGLAPAVAELMADLILDGVDHIPPSFRVEASL